MFRYGLGVLILSACAFALHLNIKRNRSWSTTSALQESNKEHELVGIIIVDHGSKRETANSMLLAVVDKYRTYPGSSSLIVEPAHMELAEPSIQQAFDKCVEQGATRIVCHPYFLSYGRHVLDDIPLLMKTAAEKHPKVPYVITKPLGMQDEIIGLIHNSIASSGWI
jgi:sirohydrochlorin ferrochelatase